MNLCSINTVNGSQFHLSLEIYNAHFLERWTYTVSMAPVQHGLCGHSEGRYCHHPAWASWDVIPKLCHWYSVGLKRKAQERAWGSCYPQPVFIYSYHRTFRLGPAGRVSPHGFFCISLITNTIEFLLYIWVTGMSSFGNVRPCLYC